MKILKKIKFIAPSKILPNSKDEFMTKLKPVLGQNQINLVNFVSDFNKKSFFLSEEVEVLGKINKLIDKSFSIDIDMPGTAILKNQLSVKDNQILIEQFQDILLLKKYFNTKNNRPTNEITFFRRTAKILLSNLESLKIKVNCEK